MENLEKIKHDNEPIADIETNEAILKEWEEKGLHKCISSLFNEDFERTVPLGGKFVLSPDNFLATKEFIHETQRDFYRTDIEKLDDDQFKNMKKLADEKVKKAREEAGKVILTFTFEDLQINPEKPVIIREEREKKRDEEIIRKYFATNRPDIVLVSDKTDWWLERKGR